MNIAYNGNGCFVMKAGKTATMAFEPGDGFSDECTCATFSSGVVNEKVKTEKALFLPGEYEMAGILIRGLYTNNQSNVVFKVTLNDIALAHFGKLKDSPRAAFYEELGENVSVAVVEMTEGIDMKKLKELLDKVGPRYVLITGPESFHKDLMDNLSAKKAEEDSLTISKSSLSEDRMDVLLFS